MSKVSSISKLPTGTNDAAVTFDNGYQMFVRIIDEQPNRTIIYTPNNKLVALDSELNCEILCEGVSIR